MDDYDKKKTTVSFKNGIHVHTDTEDVDVSLKGIHVETAKDSVHMDKGEMMDYIKQDAKKHRVRIILSICMLLVALGVYLFFGFHYGTHGWSYGWLVFLLAIAVDSLISAIEKKKPSEFAYAVLATFIFMLLGFFKGCWHPAWIIFLTIPVYYVICDKLQNNNKDE